MEIKVKDLGELESKSTQEIEKQLLEKHEAELSSDTETTEVIQKVKIVAPETQAE